MDDLKKYFMQLDMEDFDVLKSKAFGTCEFSVKDENERKEVFKKIIESIYNKYPDLR